MKIAYIAISSLLVFGASFGAGTYMGTGGYQSPQRYYQGGATGGGYYQPRNVGTSGYSGGNYYQRNQQPQYQQQRAQNQTPQKKSDVAGNGFYASAGISHQYGQWNFDMKSTGSVLNYSDLTWNVLDIKGGYKFGDWLIDGGVSYGMQSGQSTMTDDDITKGGLESKFYDNTGGYIGSVYTKVLSIGETKGGSQFGFNAGVGLMNKLGFGKVKITPSVGYRMFNHKLNTSKNNGLAVSNNWCEDLGNGEFYCPTVIYGEDGSMTWGAPDHWSNDGYGWWDDTGSYMVSNGDTYSFFQSGKTHIYDVSWSGPYVAVEFASDLNESNAVDARIELGFPGYTAKGDQPYRSDWEHPTSVEDTKDMFGATHLGLGANWTTMLDKNWGITLGLTYDYYSVSGANAKTYLNGGVYEGQLDEIFANGPWTNWEDMFSTDLVDPNDPSQGIVGDPYAVYINDLYVSCGNSWTCTMKSEVNSFYKSMGVRLGVVGKF